MMKCSRCKKEKPVNEFAESASPLQEYESICIECKKAKAKKAGIVAGENLNLEDLDELILEKQIIKESIKLKIPERSAKDFSGLTMLIEDIPDPAFPRKLTPYQVMKKYDLGYGDYLDLKKNLKEGNFRIT